MPVISEMLQRSSAIFRGTVNSKADGSDLSAWQQENALTQLGINYRWSDIVLDERIPISQDQIIDAYGKEGDPVHAGDRAPDAPKLKDVRASDETTTSLFQIFSPTQHTALIFADSISCLGPVMDALHHYPVGTVSPVLILPQSSSTPSVSTNENVVRALRDTEGHAYDIYGTFNKEVTVFMLRPDGVVGAVVCDADGIEHYRQLLFV